jgi:hypothetical protein
MSKQDEAANKKYLDELMDSNQKQIQFEKKETPQPKNDGTSSIEYLNIDINLLPAGRFYKKGTKIKIRGAKVSEIQAYSVVDNNNFIDITEKMNELLLRCVIFETHDGEKGSYRDIKDADRIFLIFMIRELTFQGGNTLTKDVQCSACDHDFVIPFRATSGKAGDATFELHKPTDLIESFFKSDECAYELINNNVSWKLSPPSIGIQEDFYNEIKRNVQNSKKPNVAFMKVTPFLLYDKSSITEEGIKTKLKEFNDIDDMALSQGLNEIINNMTVGIKGLATKCPKCGVEVHTDLTFPNGASTLFELPNILDRFRK